MPLRAVEARTIGRARDASCHSRPCVLAVEKLEKNMESDLAFFGEDQYHKWWTLHAIWLSPRGARILIRYAGRQCNTHHGIDLRSKLLCQQGMSVKRGVSVLNASELRERAWLQCHHAPNVSIVTAWGGVFRGLFGQDRLNVQPQIHSAQGNAIVPQLGQQLSKEDTLGASHGASPALRRASRQWPRPIFPNARNDPLARTDPRAATRCGSGPSAAWPKFA